MNIVLCITSSIAACLDTKLVKMMQDRGHVVKLIYSDGAKYFSRDKFNELVGITISGSMEKEYWETKHNILHIDIAQWADKLVIAPATASIIGKFANGIVDNFITSVYAAMSREKRKSGSIIIAPAMNTEMYESPAIIRNLKQLSEDGCVTVDPQVKTLACGDTGVGAMAEINEILAAIDPSENYFHLVPNGDHPGAFGYRRKHDMHTGVDLYVHRDNAIAYPFVSGKIINIYPFTGEHCGTPFWNNTWAVTIQQKNGYAVTYGEILPNPDLKFNMEVDTTTPLGKIIPVVNTRKPQYKYHNTKMLHVELHKLPDGEFPFNTKFECGDWPLGTPMPDYLIDPTRQVTQWINRIKLKYIKDIV